MSTVSIDNSAKTEKTKLILMNIYNLPPVPTVMTEVLKLIDNKSTSTAELNKVISKDQGLVTKILTIANSPLYGLQRKVTTIEFAILILGFSELRNIVSTLSLIESFKNKTDRYLDQKEFLIHSFLTGTATKRLAADLGFPNSGEAFIAGFLHDVGISVMHRYFHSNFVTIHDMIKDQGVNANVAEMEVLGLTHQQVGNLLLERWNFPLNLCDSILNHHTPKESKQNLFLSSLIHLADYMTQKLGIGNSYWDKDMVVSPEAMRVLRFSDEEKLNTFIESYKEIFETQVESIRFLA